MSFLNFSPSLLFVYLGSAHSEAFLQKLRAEDAAIEEGGLTDMLNDIINTQNYQIHVFRNHLGSILP